MLSSRERAELDAYLTRSNPRDDDEDMYCPLCGLAADACELPEEHEGEWWTQSERAQAECEDLKSELAHDAQEDA